jgi:hypothetical protein
MNEPGEWSATTIFEALVSGDRHAADTAMAALVTLGDDVDRRALRNLIRDRLQGGRGEASSDQVMTRLLTALVRITEDEQEATVRSASAERQELSRQLAIEGGGNAAFEKARARTTAVEQYTAAVDEAEGRVRALFETAVRQARLGFTLSASMDLVVFYLGVFLLAGSAVAMLLVGSTVDLRAGLAVGGVGILCILYALLIGRARRQVGQATAELVRLQVVFLAYLRHLRQIDEAFVRRLLDEAAFSASEVREFQAMVSATMDATLREIPAPSVAAGARAEPAGTRLRPEAAPQAGPEAGEGRGADDSMDEQTSQGKRSSSMTAAGNPPGTRTAVGAAEGRWLRSEGGAR